jgi:hypothetical protein
MEVPAEQFIRLPFPLMVSRHEKKIEAGITTWVRKFGLIRSDEAIERFLRARFGLYAAAIQPEAPLRNLQTYAAFVVWLFIVDDQHGEAVYESPEQWRAAVEPLQDIAQERRKPASGDAPAVHALHDVLSSVYPRMSSQWKQRFATNVSELLRAAATESLHRSRGHIPSEASYLANRRIVSGGAPLLDMVEFCASRELPPALRDTASYRSMREAATDVMAWTNDVCSVEKERTVGDPHNYLFVLAQHRDLTDRQARAWVIQRIEERVAEYQAAERDFLDGSRHEVTAPSTREAVLFCVRSMRHFMAGHDYWARTSGRYAPESAGDRALDEVL